MNQNFVAARVTSLIKDIILIFTISIIIPILVHLLLGLTFPTPDFNESKDLQEKRKQLVVLNEQKKLDLISFEQGKMKRSEVEKIQNQTNDLKHEIHTKLDEESKDFKESNKKSSAIAFSISMTFVFLLIILSFAMSDQVLKASFILASLLLVIYSNVNYWSFIPDIVKFIVLLLWFVLLILLSTKYNKEKD